MSKVAAGIATSVDGYVTGPDDGPGRGFGIGGERPHGWVFGGPRSYDWPSRDAPTGADREWMGEVLGANGAVVTGRATYEAAGHLPQRPRAADQPVSRSGFFTCG